MEKGKIIIPIVSVVALAGIIAVVLFSTSKYKNFELPSQIAVEDVITSKGMDIAKFSEKDYRILGLKGNFIKIWAKYNDKEKNKSRDMSISYISYDTVEEATKAFSDYYSAAMYSEKKSKHSGKVSFYLNEKKMTGYVLYNAVLQSDGLVDNYAFSLTNENDLLNPQSDFLYGGVYLKDKRIVYVTTSNPDRKYAVDEILDKYALPKP
ncbi:MAG: hypothetical protein K5776_08230 [Lachnospiraceae bacterium]|nr:hypothetical protein [Lachnospiraceae bacterium]